MAHFVAIAAAVAGGGLKAYGAKREGDRAKKIADYNAELERRRGEQRALAIRRKGVRVKGRQASLIGKSGVQMQGSPLEVMAETAANVELDAIHTVLDAQATSRLDEKQGEAQKKASRVRAGAAILSGVSSAGSALGGFGR